jgi:5'-3' exonuclease
MGIEDFIDEGQEIKTKREQVLLIDYHNLAMRNLFAQPYDPTDVSFLGFRIAMLMSIRKLARDFKPNRIIFCREAHDRNWRSDIYEEYKINRAAARASSTIDFDSFFPANDSFIQGLENSMKNCQFLTIPHLEADDLIASIVMKKPEWDITLISTDKDFYQLHTYFNFKQYDPIKNEFVSVMNPDAALAEKIVRGDRSDNIPPLKKGIGQKTFAKIYSNGLQDWITTNFLQEAFDRNTKLISFKSIPIEYQNQVKTAVNDFKPDSFDARYFYTFVIENGMGSFLDKINDFINIIKDIK